MKIRHVRITPIAFRDPPLLNAAGIHEPWALRSRRVAERIGGTPYSRNAGVVENKPGAGGRIACEVVKGAPPDGPTLLLTPYSCMSIYPHIYKQLSDDPFKDFVPVSRCWALTRV